MKKLFLVCGLLLVLGSNVEADTINRPTKSFGGTAFINGVVPQASDFNGDSDTIYAEFNGNISNANIKAGAAIDASKINPDGFTVNIRTVNTAPCTILDESDQASDNRIWKSCANGRLFTLYSYNSGGATKRSFLSFDDATGNSTLGDSGGTTNIYGATTFHQPVVFAGSSSVLPTGVVIQYMGTTAPSGWVLMDGGSLPCTGASAVNAALCARLVSLFGSANYKGSAASNFTVDPLSDEILHTAHARVVDDRVHFSSTATLPSPLVATTVYCVASVTADRFKVKPCGGATIDITSSGSGTHSDYFNFVTPDARGRNAIGTGSGGGLSSRTIGATGGEENHTLSVGEMPSHQHTLDSPLKLGAGGNFIGNGGTQVIGDTFTGVSGGGGSHNVMDPYLVMTFIIKL